MQHISITPRNVFMAFLVFGIVFCIPGKSKAFCVSGYCFQDLKLKGMPRGGGYMPPAAPSGPSPEELRKQAEEKDLREAADDDNDKAVEFAEKGDWDTAIKYLTEALEYEPDDDIIRNNLRKVQEYKQKASINFKSKALDEAQSNLYHTQQGSPGAVIDTPAAKKSVPLAVVPAAGQPMQMSDRVKNDPRMIKAQKKLTDIQAKRQKLDEQRTQLAKDRNSATDPEKMKQLTGKLDKVEKAYQDNLLAEFKQKEKIEKLKRTIDAEVEKPVHSGQNSKESGK